MPNKNYVKGRNKEYRICAQLKAEGYEIAQRSAGSHSPIDVFAIRKSDKKIKFIQSKPENYGKTASERIINDLEYLRGSWTVEFELI